MQLLRLKNNSKDFKIITSKCVEVKFYDKTPLFDDINEIYFQLQIIALKHDHLNY